MRILMIPLSGVMVWNSSEARRLMSSQRSIRIFWLRFIALPSLVMSWQSNCTYTSREAVSVSMPQRKCSSTSSGMVSLNGASHATMLRNVLRASKTSRAAPLIC